MTFKKIDASAAAAGQPFDAFTLHGALANQEATREGRRRRAARAYEAGNAPVLACLEALVGLPVLWPLSPGCRSLTIRLLAQSADGAVRVRPVVSQGERYPWRGEEVVVTADGLVELPCDVSGFAGVVLLGVEIQSDLDDAVVDKFSLNETGDHAYLRDDRTIYLGASANLVLDANTRYALTFGPGAAGEAYDPDYLPPRTVQWWDRGAADVDEVQIWPPYQRQRELSWLGASIDISVHKIGQIKALSLSVEEGGDCAAEPDLRDALRPGMACQARAVRQLHRRNHDNHLRTPIRSIDARPDAAALDRQGLPALTQGVCVPYEELYVIDVPVYSAATTYTVTIGGTDFDAAAAGSAALTLSALRTAIRASSANAQYQAQILGAYLVLQRRSSSAGALSVSATGGTGTIALTSTGTRGLWAGWVGSYADDKGVVDGETGDAANRCGHRIAALLHASGPPGLDEALSVDLLARLGSYDSGAWEGDLQAEDLGGAQVLCLRDDNDQLRRALRTLRYVNSNAYSTATLIPRHLPRWHTLRGLTPIWAFRAPWLTVFEGALADEEPAATHRLLRVLLSGRPWNAEGVTAGVEPTAPRLLECAAVTVWGTEEVRP